MCHASHAALYAAGPIGLVTAVVTLIRLGSSHTLQRLVGRQFESQAEVLADVTSVSRGEVTLHLRNRRLEQSIAGEDNDAAATYFAVVGGFRARGVAFWERRQKLREDIAAADSGMLRNSALGSILITSVRAEGVDPEEVARIRAHQGRGFQPREGDDGIAKCFVAWEGVSWEMTIAHNDGRRLSVADCIRFTVAGISILGYAAIIALNWRAQGDIQNTVLVTAGLAISTGGAYFTAIVVDRTTWEVPVSLREFSPLFCGYVSRGQPEGQCMPFVPPVAVMSDFNASYDQVLKHIIPPVVVLMVAGYVGLYLGLRTAEWWASLAILAISGVASLARALTAPTRAQFDAEPENDGVDEHIFPGQYGTFEDVDLRRPPEPRSSGGTIKHEVLSYSKLSWLHRSLTDITPSHQLSRPVLYGLAVAGVLKARHMIPAELAAHPLLIAETISSMYPRQPSAEPSDVAVLCTDIITGESVRRLPLDVNVLAHDRSAVPFNTYELMIPFSCWFRRWEATWEDGWAAATPPQRDEGFEDPEPSWTQTWHADAAEPKQSATNVWMAAKICLAVFLHASHADMQSFHAQLLDRRLVEPDMAQFVDKLAAFALEQKLVVDEDQLKKAEVVSKREGSLASWSEPAVIQID